MRTFLIRTAAFGIAAIAVAFVAQKVKQPDVIFDTPPKSGAQTAPASLSSNARVATAPVPAPPPSEIPPSPPAKQAGSVLIRVPFAPQAPFAVWDPLHEEACEEMALIMVKHFWDGTPLTLQQAEDEVQELVAWETAHGYGYDVTMEELAEVARERYGMTATVVRDVSVESIKKYLGQGKPIIIPAAGRDLGNPYFSGEGPWYHALVIKGYDGSRFITNDPGTKRGESYPYAHTTLLDAIHDWTGVKEEIRSGEKTMLVIQKDD